MILLQAYFLIFFGSLAIVIRIIEGNDVIPTFVFTTSNLQEISIELMFITMMTLIEQMLKEVNASLETIGK